MSRAAVLDRILTDQRMIDAGFNSNNVKPNYDGDQRPDDKMFMVLRWETQDVDARIQRGPRHLVIWVHMYREFSTDFVRIDDVIAALDDMLGSMIDVPGADGRSVNQIIPEGHSRDLRDEGYQTYCRSAAYSVLSRKT